MNSQPADPAPLRDPERGEPTLVEHSRVSVKNNRTTLRGGAQSGVQPEPPNAVEGSPASVVNNRTTLRGGASSLRVGDSSGSETGAEPDRPNDRTG